MGIWMGRTLRLLKMTLVNWLFRDIELEELRVKNIRMGNGTIVIAPDYIDLAPLTADPPLATGRVWFRSDIPTCRYSPDGVEVVDF